MATEKTLREQAIEWWNTLDSNTQLKYWRNYGESVFTPSLYPSQLTGREIQAIWSVFKNKNTDATPVEEDEDTEIAKLEEALFNEPTGFPLSKKHDGYTQGEWYLQGQKINKEMGNQVYYSICTKNPEIKDNSYKMVGFYYPHSVQDVSEMEANANLIASAPRLKEENEALKKQNEALISIAKTVVFWYGNNSHYPEGCAGYTLAQQAKSAIENKI